MDRERRDDLGLGGPRLLDRRRRRVDAHRPVREHLPANGRRLTCTTSWPTHEIPWTDQSVKDALTAMAEVVGDTDNIAGGTDGALQTDFPTSVTQVFADPPKAAQVIEGDFVAGVITDSTKAQPGRASTSSRSRRSAIRAAWSSAAATPSSCSRTRPAGQAFVEYLTTPEAAEIWAAKGGFASLNKNVDPSVYPDDITQHDGRRPRRRGGRSASTSPTSSPRRSAARSGRACSRSSRTSWPIPTTSTESPKQMEDAAAKAYGN